MSSTAVADTECEERRPTYSADSVSTCSVSVVLDGRPENEDVDPLLILRNLLGGERRYNEKLRLALHFLHRQQLAGFASEVRLIVDALEPICAASSALLGKLEYLLDRKLRLVRGGARDGVYCSEIAALFGHSLWAQYDRYHAAYSTTIRNVVRVKRRTDSAFVQVLHEIESACGTTFEYLLLLPEDRVVAYHAALTKFARSTSTDESRKQLEETLDSLSGSGAIDARREEIVSVRNEQRVEEIESRFDYGVQLLEQPSAGDMRKFGRRRSSSLLERAGVVTAKFPASSNGAVEHDEGRLVMPAHKDEHGPIVDSRQTSGSVRTYLKEGRVQLSTSLQTQERYLFLFNDLLLVAKEKGVNSYKLKEKIRLCEVWIRSGGVEEVSECVRNPTNSFVVGWPTSNYVAEFESPIERNAWLALLEQTIGGEKERETPKVTTVKVYLKAPHKNTEVRRIPLNNLQTASDVKKIVVAEFDLNPDTPFQLWVHSAKENGPYPLFGHESPFAILMSHVRDSLQDSGHELTLREMEDLASVAAIGTKCRFVLRPRAHSAAPSARRSRLRRAAPGHLVSQIKKRVLSKTDSVDLGPPPAPVGAFFGQPLHQLTDDNSIPAPLMKMLGHIYREGGLVEGIFRKPPKQSTVKALKALLDDGKPVDFDGEHYPLVTASLLKDFLRNIPQKLLVSDLYYTWMSDVCDEQVQERKVQHARKLLSQLPPANYQLLRYLLCVLNHVAAMESTSKMSASSLSVCIGPSLLEKQNGAADVNDSVRRIPQLTQFLIEHVADLFGAETLNLFGPPPETLVAKPDSGEESDFGHLRQDFSSVDSLPVSGSSPGGSRPHSSSLVRNPANESRDSGLSENYLTDDGSHIPLMRTHAASVDRSPSSRPQAVRSFSETDDGDDPVTFVSAKSTSDLTVVSGTNLTAVESPSSRKRSALDDMHDNRRLSAAMMTHSWHPDLHLVDESAAPPTSTASHYRRASRQSTASSASPDFEPLDAAAVGGRETSFLDEASPRVNGLRNSKRIAFGTLKRSESGEHLLLSEGAPPQAPQLPMMTLALPVNDSITVVSTSSSENSPGAGSVTIVTTPDRPPNLSRHGLYRRAVHHRPSPPLSGQSSLSPEDTSEAELDDMLPGPIVIRCNSKDDQSPPPLPSVEPPSADIYSVRKTNMSAHQTHSEASSSGASSLSSLNGSESSEAESTKQTSMMKPSPIWAPPILPPRRTSQGVQKEQRSVGVRRDTLGSHDSSTVTESSDDDEKTPVVSRENSRVQELQSSKARFLTTASDRRHVPVIPIGRPRYSWEASPQNDKTTRPADVPPPSTHHHRLAAAPTRRDHREGASRNGAPTEQKPLHKMQPPTYEETMRRRSLRGEETASEIIAARERISAVLSRKASNTLERSVPVIESVTIAARSYLNSTAPSASQSKVLVQARKLDRSRRKTLGGDEYRLLSELCAPPSTTAAPAANVSISSSGAANPPSRPTIIRSGSIERLDRLQQWREQRPIEINWSVNRLRSMFDEPRPSRLSDTSSRRLPWTKEVLTTTVDTNKVVYRTPVDSRTHLQWKSGMYPPATVRTYSSASALSPSLSPTASSYSSGSVRMSHSQANYPVVTPPPLQPDSTRAKTAYNRAPLRLSTCPQRPVGLVRSLASTFEGATVSSPSSSNHKSGEISYV